MEVEGKGERETCASEVREHQDRQTSERERANQHIQFDDDLIKRLLLVLGHKR